MMDIERLEMATRAALVPACNGTDQRLDVAVTLLQEILRELQMLRESSDLQNIHGTTADVRVIHAAENRADPDPVEVDVTTHTTGELQPKKPPRTRRAK